MSNLLQSTVVKYWFSEVLRKLSYHVSLPFVWNGSGCSLKALGDIVGLTDLGDVVILGELGELIRPVRFKEADCFAVSFFQVPSIFFLSSAAKRLTEDSPISGFFCCCASSSDLSCKIKKQ